MREQENRDTRLCPIEESKKMLTYIAGVITGIVVLNLVERYFGERDTMTIPQDLSLLPADMGGCSSHAMAWQAHCEIEERILAMQNAWEEANMLVPSDTGMAIPLPVLHSVILAMRSEGLVTLSALEGRQGLSRAELETSIKEGEDRLGWVSLTE